MAKHGKKPSEGDVLTDAINEMGHGESLERRVAAVEAHLAVLEAAAKKYLKMLRQARGGHDE